MNIRTLGNYLSGRREPRVTELVALARAGGVNIAWLAADEGHMRPEIVPPERTEGAHRIEQEKAAYEGDDDEIRQAAISGVIQFVQERGLSWSPEKQAFFASLAYTWFLRNKGRVKPDDIAFRRFMEQLT